MNSYDFIVYGNTIGALVSALELAPQHRVALVNPTPNWGAHFGGTRINGVNFDIGMIFFEFSTFFEQSTDLMSYSTTVRNDCARFFNVVHKYFEDLLPITESPIPQCTIAGRFADDIILANDLSILSMLPQDQQQQIRAELEEIIAKGRAPLHAANKKTNEQLFLDTSYRDASIANHGITFHELFIEPICRKIFNISSADMPAIYHRIAWAPLFYPETVLAGFHNPKGNLTPTIFRYPQAGYFAKSIEALVEKVNAHPGITIIRDKVSRIENSGGYTVHFAEGSISGQTMVWCNDLQTLSSLTGINTSAPAFTRTSLAVAFLNVDSGLIERKFSTLYVCDTDEVIYRVTNQDEMAGTGNAQSRLVVEFNNGLLEKAGLMDEQAIAAHTISALQRLGIVAAPLSAESITVKYFKNVINLPVLENKNIFQSLHDHALDSLSDIELVGMAAGFVSTSFNDQVVQALKLGVKYSKNA